MAPKHPPTLASGIRDNHHRGSVGDFLKDHLVPDATLAIVSAYFTIHAFASLQDHLESIQHLRFLYGEPRFITHIDPDKTDTKAFAITDEGLSLTNQLAQKPIARACADWIRACVEIRSVRQTNLLHGKMYHITHGGTEHAIMGSSNFTVRGLGLGAQGNNLELNLEVDSNRDRQDLLAWFNEIWNDETLVEDVQAEVLRYLERLYENHPPQFVYYKTLYHLFEQYLALQDHSTTTNQQHQLAHTHIWNKLFAFQQDGVKGAITKILTHNGCILADSVGLGKTYEALAIIKYFELQNNRVLVLCPKKLRENWTVYQAQNNSKLNPFGQDRFSYTVLSHTDLSRDRGKSGDIDLAMVNWGNYDLVVIDESHNFRNNTRGRRDEDGNVIRKSRYERLMEDILQQGVKTKVLLLSATPVNTDLTDLRNQIMLITEGSPAAFEQSLGIADVGQLLAEAQKTFNAWARQANRTTATLLTTLSATFFTLLDGLTIARSRKHIQRYYSETIAELGGFPERLKPITVSVGIDSKGRFPSYDRLHDDISHYQLSLFNPSKYVRPAYRAQYDVPVRNFRQADREHHLIGMMRVNLLKRIESSVHAFAITLERMIEKIEALEARLQQFHQRQQDQSSLDTDQLSLDDQDDEELQTVLQVGRTQTFDLAHLDTHAWLQDLQQDKQQLNSIFVVAKDVDVSRDAKLAKLRELLTHKVQSPTTNRFEQPNRKAVVFTAFADTAVYLYDALHDWAQQQGVHIALVTGSRENKTTLGSREFHHILTNFAPHAKQRAAIPSMPQDEEIDVLIATDCISEGQNLQDCDYLINYDIHWNPVRIIQRFGRIDRIGSPNDQVQLVNFWATPDLNKYLDLRNRVEARMSLVDVTATAHDNLLVEEKQALVQEELSYRDKQLLRLQDEVLDMEDFNESVALNAFTLDDFRIDLSNYIERNRKALRDAPLGIYAVVPPDPAYPAIEPGVIFCLRQKGDYLATQTTVNPLSPYFLVYVHETGRVQYTFTQPKQLLEIYQLVCGGQATVSQALCDCFDQRTDNGLAMDKYNDLLRTAVKSVTRTFQHRMGTHLTMGGRGALLVNQEQQVQATTDFDLITWLVLLDTEK